MTDLKENSSGLIPFSYQEVKALDRIVHIFTVNDRTLYIDMGYLYGIQEWINGEKALYISKQQDFILPSCWNLYIDRRPRYKRLLDSLLGITIKSEK